MPAWIEGLRLETTMMQHLQEAIRCVGESTGYRFPLRTVLIWGRVAIDSHPMSGSTAGDRLNADAPFPCPLGVSSLAGSPQSRPLPLHSQVAFHSRPPPLASPRNAEISVVSTLDQVAITPRTARRPGQADGYMNPRRCHFMAGSGTVHECRCTQSSHSNLKIQKHDSPPC